MCAHTHTHSQHVDSCGLHLLSEEDSDERLGVKRIKEALQAHMWPDMTLKPRHEPAQPAANPKPQDPLPDTDEGEPSQGSEHSSTETSTALTGTDVTKCTYCISQVVPLSVCPVCDQLLLCPLHSRAGGRLSVLCFPMQTPCCLMTLCLQVSLRTPAGMKWTRVNLSHLIGSSPSCLS